jgi:hypothetical protein
VRRLLVLAAALVVAGCGGGDGDPGPALRETAAGLEKVESGVLSLSVRMKPSDGDEFGYDIEGPVRLGTEERPATADVEYTQVANGQEATVRLVLAEDGSGFIESNGERTDLTEEQLADLRDSGSLLGQEGLSGLRFADWVADPELDSGDDVDEVKGELDVATALTALQALTGVLAEDVTLTAEQRQEVADAVDESSFELRTGADDRLLRRLALSFTLDEEVREELRDALGQDSVGASFSFELGLDQVNEPVSIGG